MILWWLELDFFRRFDVGDGEGIVVVLVVHGVERVGEERTIES